MSEYLLEFWFDAEEVSDVDAFKKEVAKALGKRAPSVQHDVEKMPWGPLKLWLKGTLREMDACHMRLNDNVICNYDCIRVKDELSEELRRQAYPILGRVETCLRRFIQRAMIQTLDFDWWDQIGHLLGQQIPETVTDVQDKIADDKEIYHPLTLLYFGQLVLFLTSFYREWQEKQHLKVSDLKGLLSHCSSLDEMQEVLNQKTRKHNLWEETFGAYFSNEEAEALVRERLGKVIRLRNVVMHHRVVYHLELKRLRRTASKLERVLESAKPELSEEERKRAGEAFERFSQHLIVDLLRSVRQVETLAESGYMPDISSHLQAIREQERRWREMAESWYMSDISSHAQLVQEASPEMRVGSISGSKFHLETCPYARRISEENFRRFRDRDEAIEEGYKACSVCQP